MRQKKLILLTFLIVLSWGGTAQITSNFDTNDEGWTVSDLSDANAQPVTYHPTGGNPGGYVSVTLTNCCNFYWKVPSKFLGSHCQDSYGKNLKFDLQLSAAGVITNASTNSGNVRITSGPYIIVANITPDPAVTPGWTSYTVALDETTAWHNSNTTTPLSTYTDIINALSNINKIEIVSQAAFGSDPDVSIDNFTLEQKVFPTPPKITSFAPQSGIPGASSIVINGSNFNASAGNNVVYFGGVTATITSTSATQLTVTIPPGAAYAPISVYNKATGLSASTNIPFQPRFDNNKDHGGQVIRASMAPAISFDVDGYSGTNAAGDIDGDGLNDIVVGEGGGGFGGFKQFSVYRNAGVTGTISSASFHPKVPIILTLPYVKAFTALADFDGDGKLDVAISSASTFYAYTTIFRNTSTPGNISFAPEQNYAGIGYSDGPLATADMDGDGRPEIISIFNNNCANGDRLFIHPNISIPGNIDFCGPILFGPVYTCGGHLTIGDLDGDKLPDVVVDASSLTVFRNTCTPGNFSLAAPFVFTTTAGGRPVLADLDDDGKTDIAWPSDATHIEIRKNNYSGGIFDESSFTSGITYVPTINSLSEIIACDVNSDGKLDLVMSSSAEMAIAENVTTAGSLNANSFLPAIPYAINLGTSYPINPITADFDGDNKQDIIVRVTNTTPKQMLIFRNESYPSPRIDNFSPTSGTSGTTINFTGINLSTGNVPVIAGRLGTLPATINTSSNTTGSITIPTNATSGRVSLSEHGLTALSKSLHVLFGTSRTIDATSFSGGIDFPLSNNTRDALDIADFDDDGKPDVVVVDNYSTSKIFKNTQTTAGQPVTSSSLTLEATTYSAGYNVQTLDIDGDGKTDLNNGYGLIKNNSTPGTISFLYGPGVYTYSGGFNYAAAADFNKDGKTDLATTNGSLYVQIYENRSTKEPFVNDSQFSTFNINAINLAKPGNYGGIVAEDFDGDGYDDIATVSPLTDNFTVYQNLKLYGPLTTACFSSGSTTTTGNNPYSITANDFDGDGKTDLAITYFDEAFISVYRNTSSGGIISFAATVDLPCLIKGYNIASQDLDGDGLAEIVIIHRPNPGPGSFSVLQNKSTSGAINFNAAVNFPLTSPNRNPQALSFADINLDKKPDILIVGEPYATGTTGLTVFENKITTGPVITIVKQPIDATACEGSPATFETDAIGATNIDYQWQHSPNTGTYIDLTSGGGYSGVSAKTLSVTSSKLLEGRYRCKISGDLATTVFTNDVGLVINTIPAAPITTGDSDCNPKALTLTASGASNGQYLWFDAPTNGPIGGETNNTYTTPVISSTTTYYAAIKISDCESTRTPVIGEIKSLNKPVITFNPPVANVSVIILCGSDIETLTAPPGFTDYHWTNGSSNSSIEVSTADVYAVTVTDTKGCHATSDLASITVNPYPSALITQAESELTASPGDTYQWYHSGNSIGNATNQSISINIFEYGAYSVDVTLDGCTTTSDEFIYLITGTEVISKTIQNYPNPFGDFFIVENNSKNSAMAIVYDQLGHKLFTNYLPAGITVINSQSLSSGFYILEISNKDNKSIRKLKKQ